MFGLISAGLQALVAYDRCVFFLKWLTRALFAYVAVALVVRVPWSAVAARLGTGVSAMRPAKW